MTEENQNGRIQTVDLSTTMRKSFLDYAMSVIVARALPDVRDGLKPVHRRILYGMNDLGVTPDKAYKKSARIVGDVMGKYHPHGDSAIYESMVRMAQPFSYRYMLVDGHGNFGSIDGDGAAAMRYTESRMSKMAVEMLRDINKDTVDFRPNYDGSEKEPAVLPARFPNLLVNGATGIAVGMTTNIPTHNLGEVIGAIHVLMNNSDATVEELQAELPGPDFPTGGIIQGLAGVRSAYKTGKGTINIRGKVEIQTDAKGRETIVVTELPYMVNKARLVEKIAELARDKRITGISDLTDESDRDGMRVVIKIKKDASGSVVLNNLYKMTSLQTSFAINMVAIVDGAPKVLNLKEILQYYINHQMEIIVRRTRFDLKRAQARAHILEGLLIALDNINEVIKIIRSSKTANIAKETLMDRFPLSDKQSQAILDMRLVRLTGLERDKIINEHKELIDKIADFEDILQKPERVQEIIYQELLELKERHGDARRSRIEAGEITNVEDAELIEEEDIIISLSHKGYIKRMSADEFKVQNRGGRGITGMSLTDGDFIEQLVSASSHDTLLFFTNSGKTYRMKGYEIPEYGRTAKGIPVVNLLKVGSTEKVQAIINIDATDAKDQNLFFITRLGTVKKTSVVNFTNIRSNGLKAINLRDEDELSNVVLTDGTKNIIIGTRNGYAVSFNESDVRNMGRTATGVRGIKLRNDDYVIGSGILDEDKSVFIISERGYGKLTPAAKYGVKHRGGKGVKTANISEKNGPLVGLLTVDQSEDLLLITNKGVIIRIKSSEVSETGRATLGVKLIKVTDDTKVSTVAKIEEHEEEVAREEVAEQIAIEEDDNIDG